MVIVDNDIIVEGNLRAMLAYWEAKRPAADQLPGRRDIDPVEFPELLKHVFLVDVSEDPRRYFCRVAGHIVCGIYDREVTGRHVDEIFAEDVYSVVSRQFDEPVRHARPCYHANEHRIGRTGTIRFERILLPLSEDGNRINMLLGGAALLPERLPEGDTDEPPVGSGTFVELVGPSILVEHDRIRPRHSAGGIFRRD